MRTVLAMRALGDVATSFLTMPHRPLLGEPAKAEPGEEAVGAGLAVGDLAGEQGLVGVAMPLAVVATMAPMRRWPAAEAEDGRSSAAPGPSEEEEEAAAVAGRRCVKATVRRSTAVALLGRMSALVWR